MRSLHREEWGQAGDISAISAAFSQHGKPEQRCPPCQFCMLRVFVVCVHVDQNAPLQCRRGGKNPCTGSNRVVTYFRSFSSGAHVPCHRVPPPSRSRPILTDSTASGAVLPHQLHPEHACDPASVHPESRRNLPPQPRETCF